MTTEYLLETYSEGVTRRFFLPKKEYMAIVNYNKSPDNDILDSTWEFIDIKGGYVSLDMRKLTGFRLYKKVNSNQNPLNSDEVYEDPLS